MAKANLTLPDGTKVTIEGTAEEVSTLLKMFSATTSPASQGKKTTKKTRKTTRARKKIKQRKGPQALIEELADENYFKSKRTIGDVQKRLEEKGHIYALTSLSSPLLRLTKKKVLRRLKEKSGWVYVS